MTILTCEVAMNRMPLNRPLIPVLCLVLVASIPAAAASGSGTKILGAWQSVESKDTLILFEKDRCLVREKGRTRFYLARYRKDRAEVWIRGEYVPWRFTLEGKVLVLDRGKGQTELRRLRKPPSDLEPRPLGLGRKKPGASQREAMLAELRRRVELDQAVRKDRRRMAEMGKVDRDNTAWLRKQVTAFGWIDARRFGRRAAGDAFLIVQHSGDLPLMLAAMPAIKKDFANGHVDAQSYCLLYDRLQMRLGHKQRYGSQLETDRRGEMVIYPLENPRKVEALRKKAGLMPLERYLELIERTYHKRVKREPE
jgi:hypothetical protein